MLIAVSLVILTFTGCQQLANEEATKEPPVQEDVAADPSPDHKTQSLFNGTSLDQWTKTQVLFDGKSLDQWELTEFGGEGDVTIEDGCILMDSGDPITAINLPESFPLPTNNYEVAYEAMKVEGTDFFGTLTFPVDDSFCSLVIGGWAGTVVGLSTLDNLDASENKTRRLKKFEVQQWYKIRVRVTPDAIKAWIDDELMVDQPLEGEKISIRPEMIPCRPLGIANFYTVTKIRKIELRTLADSDSP